MRFERSKLPSKYLSTESKLGTYIVVDEKYQVINALGFQEARPRRIKGEDPDSGAKSPWPKHNPLFTAPQRNREPCLAPSCDVSAQPRWFYSLTRLKIFGGIDGSDFAGLAGAIGGHPPR